MKICIVAPFFPSKTKEKLAGIFLYRQVQALTPLDYEFNICVPQRASLPSFEVIDGANVYRVKSMFMPRVRYPFPDLKSLTHIILSMIDKEDIDVLEFYNQDYLTALPFFYVRKKRDTPVTVTVNGLPGISWFYGTRMVDAAGWLQTYLFGKRIIKKADRVRVLCQSLLKDLEDFGVNKKRIDVIHNGVDLHTFAPPENKAEMKKKLGIDPGSTVILYVGRIAPVKGTSYLLKAASRILSQYECTLVFVGNSDPFTVYPDLCSPIKDKIQFLGFREDVSPIMKASDIFVLPSISEGCPNAVLEASASALPVVASGVGAVPELVLHNKTGFVVPPKNVKKLQEKLELLLKDAGLRNEFGERGRKHMEENFSWEKAADNLDKFYRAVI